MNAVAIAGMLVETVMEVGDEGVPSGIAYAALMGIVDLETYQGIVGALCKAGLLELRHDVLHLGAKSKAAIAAQHEKEQLNGPERNAETNSPTIKCSST